MFLTQHYLENVVAVLHTYLDHLTSVMFTVTEMFLHFDDSMRASDYGDFCALKMYFSFNCLACIVIDP